MITEAIEKIISLKTPEQIAIAGKNYRKNGYTPVLDFYPEDLNINNLTGIVDFVKKNPEKWTDLFIHVRDYNSVVLYKSMCGDFNQRNSIVAAGSRSCQFAFSRQMDVEDFVIALNSTFVQNDDRDYLLKFVSAVRVDANTTLKDDGISQSVTARQGTSSLVSDIDIKPIVNLIPYRTFDDVEQPESAFVFRMKINKQAATPSLALYECDGAAWKQTAIQSIKEFLKKELPTIPVIA